MKKLALFLALALLASLFPAAMAEETLIVYNCYDYIDSDVIKDFEKETGIKVKYLNYTTNEEMYMKMTSGGGVYDVIFPSDYMIERLIAEDALMELDYSKIPNANGMLDWLKDTDYDAGTPCPTCGAPWASCITRNTSTSPSPAGRACSTPGIRTTCSCSSPCATPSA